MTIPGKNPDAAAERIAGDLRHLSAEQRTERGLGEDRGDRGVAKPLTTSDGPMSGRCRRHGLRNPGSSIKKWQRLAGRGKNGSKNQKKAYRKQYEGKSETSRPIKRATNSLPTMPSLCMSSRTCAWAPWPNAGRSKKTPRVGFFPIAPKPGLIVPSCRRLGGASCPVYQLLSGGPPIKAHQATGIFRKLGPERPEVTTGANAPGAGIAGAENDGLDPGDPRKHSKG